MTRKIQESLDHWILLLSTHILAIFFEELHG